MAQALPKEISEVATVGSLFSGIGGLDLGLERAGFQVIWQAENNPYCQKVLKKHWPDTRLYEDVREINEYTQAPFLLAGGFPCQPVSVAGRRKAQEDSRWLWPEFARIIRLLRPRFVLVENVPGLLTTTQGRAAQEVFGDLAACGYDAEWDCIPAAAFGAPHLRYRVFIVAFAAEKRPQERGISAERRALVAHATRCGRGGEDAHAADAKRQELRNEPGRCPGASRESTPEPRDDGATGTLADAKMFNGECKSAGSRRRLSESPPRDCGWWLTEPNVGRVAHGVPARVDRLKGLGNAVVPQVAEWVGRRILNGIYFSVQS